MSERTKAEVEFINQYTRQLMVEWAALCIAKGNLPEEVFAPERAEVNPYVAWAHQKEWITKRAPRKLTAAGFAVATAFLRR